MEFEHSSGIYMCTCTANNKSYIGQSVDVKLRKTQHLSELRYNKHFNEYLQKSYNKYGEDSLVWEVLEYCDKDNLDDREIYWIAQHDTVDNGFNATVGGTANRVFKRTPEFRERLSQTLTESWKDADDRRASISKRMTGSGNPMYGRYGSLNPAYGTDHSGNFNGMYGKKQSEHTKELNRQAHLGLKNKNSTPIVCIETGEIYESQGAAKRITGINDTSICKCLKGVKKTAGGFHWRYATTDEIDKLKQNIYS